MRLLVAFLLLCSTAFAADPSTGPLFSIWHIDGHGYQWQAEQVSAGLPLEPSIRMPNSTLLGSTATVTGNATLLRRFDGGPIVLRMNNVLQELGWTLPSFGTIPSPWSSIADWETVGRTWATSAWMQALQETIPRPASIILRENAEGNTLPYNSLYVATRVKWYRADNQTYQFGNINTPREKWLYAETLQPIIGDDWKIYDADANERLHICRWKTADELNAIDTRANAWVEPRRATLPTDNQNVAAFYTLYRERHQALFSAFRANFSASWRAVPFRTVSYNVGLGHDASSLQTYTNYYERPGPLTAAFYRNEIATRRSRWQSGSIPGAWRELSIRLRGPTVFAAVQDNTGDFVDAESYAGFNAHYCWALQTPGKEVRLTWFEGYLTKPEYRVTGDNATWSATLNALGRSDLNAMTVGQCEVAIMQRMREIHEHKTLRRYWQQGTTELLPSSQNTTTLTRVYATATSLPDSPRKLLVVYTPCRSTDFSGDLNAGQWNVPYARFAYYLTDPLVPLPPPTMTVEERLDRLELEVFGQSEDSE